MAYLAPTLARLRTEVNAKWPDRDRTSDGWIGDTSHQARPSDHNPDPPVIGVVRALDIDIDGISELDVIAAMLRHDATNYVIFDGRISQRVNGFAWRAYTGPSPHRGHVHVSIRRGQENAAGAWLYMAPTTTVGNPGDGGGSVPTIPTAPTPTAPSPIKPKDGFLMGLNDAEQAEVLSHLRAIRADVKGAPNTLAGIKAAVDVVPEQVAAHLGADARAFKVVDTNAVWLDLGFARRRLSPEQASAYSTARSAALHPMDAFWELPVVGDPTDVGEVLRRPLDFDPTGACWALEPTPDGLRRRWVQPGVAYSDAVVTTIPAASKVWDIAWVGDTPPAPSIV